MVKKIMVTVRTFMTAFMTFFMAVGTVVGKFVMTDWTLMMFKLTLITITWRFKIIHIVTSLHIILYIICKLGKNAPCLPNMKKQLQNYLNNWIDTFVVFFNSPKM
jgi:uncharacterized membrane protein YccC